MKGVSLSLLIGCLGLALNANAADGIRKIIHPDGSVEYTNVGAAQRQLTHRSAKREESIYKYRQPNGVLTFSDQRPARGIEYQTLKFACFACNPTSSINWNSIRLNTAAFTTEINRAASTFSVDPALIRAVMHAESAFKPDAISSQGAQGLMQLMPGTAKELGVSNAMDAKQNIFGGTQYLAELLQRFGGDIKHAVAAYNAGPGAVMKYNGIPPFAETQAYVKRVSILHKRYQQND
jgi:soluble lytic murein transglycosylase-like protein